MKRHGKGSSERAYAVFRYVVPTDMKKEFISRWRVSVVESGVEHQLQP